MLEEGKLVKSGVTKGLYQLKIEGTNLESDVQHLPYDFRFFIFIIVLHFDGGKT
jgi:hypothetical protein